MKVTDPTGFATMMPAGRHVANAFTLSQSERRLVLHGISVSTPRLGVDEYNLLVDDGGRLRGACRGSTPGYEWLHILEALPLN